MSVTNETSLVERLAARFGDMLTVKVERNEVTAEVSPRDLTAVATALRDETGFRFTIVIDVCGIDYLSYGQTEWDTDTAHGESFSRGVEGQGAGRFTWAERPRQVEQPRRYAAIIHLLSIELNQRIRLRISASALRSVEHRGGLDAFLTKAADTELSPKARLIKKQISKKASEAVVSAAA